MRIILVSYLAAKQSVKIMTKFSQTFKDNRNHSSIFKLHSAKEKNDTYTLKKACLPHTCFEK